MIGLMVRGDGTGTKLDPIQAGIAVGMRPDRARNWSHRADFYRELLAERRQFRREIASGNELTLLDLRDNSANGMVRLKAVELIQGLSAEESARPHDDNTPRFTVQIVNRIAAPEPPAITISARTVPAPDGASRPYEPDPESQPEPIFTPRRWP